MKTSSLGYLIREGFRSLWTNRNMALASVGVLLSCLVLLGSAVLVVLNINQAVGWMESQNIVMVYLKSGTTQADIDAVQSKFGQMDNIAETKFISKEEALETQKKALGEDGDLFDGYKGENPFPDAYQVSVKDVERYTETVEELRGITQVEKVSERTEEAETMLNVRNTVSVISFWVIGLLILVALFIISNTIKITIYERRLEVSIMKSVGATNGFITMPFIIEGMLIGLIAGLLSTGILWYVYGLAADGIFKMSAFATLVPFSDVGWLILLCFLGIGMAAGALGSFISVQRYLRTNGGGVYNVL